MQTLLLFFCLGLPILIAVFDFFLRSQVIAGISFSMAILFYYPHFVSTYFRLWNERKSLKSLEVVRILLVPFLFLGCFIYFICQRLRGKSWADVPLSWLFLSVLVIALLHFSMQTYGLVKTLVGRQLNDLKALKALIVFVSCIGLFIGLSFHGGALFLESVHTPHLRIDMRILITLQTLGVSGLLVFCGRIWKSCLDLRSKLLSIWLILSHVTLWTYPSFTGAFLYLVPTLHGVQYLPVAFKNTEKLIESAFKSILFIILGLILMFYSPNLIHLILSEKYEIPSGLVLATFAVFINFHHAIIENQLWKRRVIGHTDPKDPLLVLF